MTLRACLLSILSAVTLAALCRAQAPAPPPPPTAPLPPPGAFPLPELQPGPPAIPAPFVPPVGPAKQPAVKVGDFVGPDVDAALIKLFGANSPESRRPIRFVLGGNLMIAADSAVFDGALRFENATVVFVTLGETFRCEACVAEVSQPIGRLEDLTLQHLRSLEMPLKETTVRVELFQDGQRTRMMTRTLQVSTPNGNTFQTVAEQVIAPNGIEFHYKFRIDPKATAAELLPAAPKAPAAGPIPFNEDLSKVAEVSLAAPVLKSLTKQQATQAIAGMMAKMNHLNAKQTDGFMIALNERRADLRGLPFLMGDECRTREEGARAFGLHAESIQVQLRASRENIPSFWSGMRNQFIDSEHAQRAQVAALTQILMPESEQARLGLAKHLSSVSNVEATRALARLVLFSPEADIRTVAVEALKVRRERDYTPILLSGFHYPLPAVARRAAEALVKLDRQDLAGDLVAVLEQPDPRLPFKDTDKGEDTIKVRELVKINHHRNCLLCHAPGNTDNTPAAALKVMVPLPTEAFSKPSDDGGSPYQKASPSLPDIVVRLDMTYLRQDFSLMMPVADAHPWPEMQRFDFLVRTRAVTPDEAKAYRAPEEDATRPSPYHRAALFALRELTGRDAEPSATAWREVLKRRS